MATAILTDLFERAGCKWLDPTILQPADPFLNAAGEAFRKSLFVTNRVDGQTLCLRPEFTIPVCLQHRGVSARYYYEGSVFRQQKSSADEEPQEFPQAGVEALGEDDFARADTDMVRLALEAVQSLSDIKPEIIIGDSAFFNAFVGPIGLPQIWRERLMRAFGDADLLERVISRMISVSPDADTRFENRDIKVITDEIATMMSKHALAGAGGRTPEEIAARFLKKHDEQAQVPADVAEICQFFLALECAFDHVGETMMRFGAQNGVDFSHAVSCFDKRGKAGLSDLDVPMSFAASFGRRLDYYTGFVFEIYDADNRANGPVAGGGRYDHLIEMLGGPSLPAVGFSLWLNRFSQQGQS